MNADRDEELARLLTLAQGGDSHAYERFLQEAGREIRVFASRRIESREAAEDVVQETLIAIHKARHTFRPGLAVGPWMFAIAGHRVTDFFRQHRRRERREIPGLEPVLDTPAPSAPEDTRGEFARNALKGLPGRQRHVIELLKLEGLSVRDVASRTGLSESAVKVTAFRGYETIRRLFRGGTE